MLSYTTSIWFEWELFRIFFILLSDNLYFSLNVPSHQCNCLAIDSHHTIVIVPSTRRTIFFMPKNDDKKPKNHVLTQKRKQKLILMTQKQKKYNNANHGQSFNSVEVKYLLALLLRPSDAFSPSVKSSNQTGMTKSVEFLTYFLRSILTIEEIKPFV